jgi:hypothetical protein
MQTAINRVLHLKHYEIFLIFGGLLLAPMEFSDNNFFNLIFKLIIISILSYVYFYTILHYIKIKVSTPVREFRILNIIFFMRAVSGLAIPVIFLIDNTRVELSNNFAGFVAFIVTVGPMLFISSIAWLYLINYLAKNLYFIQNRKTGAFFDYLIYFLAFLFIPVGIFIVQPILNESYPDRNEL